MEHIQSPMPLIFDSGKVSIFLAGPIELGTAIDWQTTLETI
jgi:hypothetical protein